jgi:hypothetical protein
VFTHEGAFVCVGDLQIGDMSPYVIPEIMAVSTTRRGRKLPRSLIRGRVSAKDVPQNTRMMERLPTVISLDDADHLSHGTSFVLQPTNAKARLQAQGDFRVRIGKFLLHELEGRERSLELMSLQRVLSGLRKTRFERTDHAPGNTIARVVEAGERRADAYCTGHQCVVRNLDLVHEYGSCRRDAQRELIPDFGRRKSLRAL